MKSIAWTDELLVGHDVIDRDHRRIVDSITVLCESLETGTPNERAVGQLGTVIDLISAHYEHEEHLMRAIRFPGVDGHIVAHGRFFSDLTRLFYRLEQGESGAVRGVLACLYEWAFDHVLLYDKGVARYLAETQAA